MSQQNPLHRTSDLGIVYFCYERRDADRSSASFGQHRTLEAEAESAMKQSLNMFITPEIHVSFEQLAVFANSGASLSKAVSRLKAVAIASVAGAATPRPTSASGYPR